MSANARPYALNTEHWRSWKLVGCMRVDAEIRLVIEDPYGNQYRVRAQETDDRWQPLPMEKGSTCGECGTLRTRNGYETVTCRLPADHDGDHEARHGTALSRWPSRKGSS